MSPQIPAPDSSDSSTSPRMSKPSVRQQNLGITPTRHAEIPIDGRMLDLLSLSGAIAPMPDRAAIKTSCYSWYQLLVTDGRILMSQSGICGGGHSPYAFDLNREPPFTSHGSLQTLLARVLNSPASSSAKRAALAATPRAAETRCAYCFFCGAQGRDDHAVRRAARTPEPVRRRSNDFRLAEQQDHREPRIGTARSNRVCMDIDFALCERPVG